MQNLPTSNNLSIIDLAYFLDEYKHQNTPLSKETLTKVVADRFLLSRIGRSFYVSSNFAIRFSWITNPNSSFSNTVIALSTLKNYDTIPFLVCVVRPENIELYLANTTFLKKVSHSSQKLSIDNIKGSFNGSDIVREYSGIPNTPANFNKLFLQHQEFTWEDNLLRLVDATTGIVPRGETFDPSPQQKETILQSVDIASSLSFHEEYKALEIELRSKVDKVSKKIFESTAKNNVNLRGNEIEQLITQSPNSHSLEDLQYELPSGVTILVDIKTKRLDLASNPKAYNVDKYLSALSKGNTVFCFFFLGLDLQKQIIYTKLVSVLDDTIRTATHMQPLWAGRNSRGATQLSGDLSVIFAPTFTERITVVEAKEFLQSLVTGSTL